MARYQVILAYDGTCFQGFQRQAENRTVQGVVEAALRRLGWSGKSILSAGRTDSGVHATGQVIAFDLEWGHTPQDMRQALNAYLPDDVAAQSVQRVPPDFHPRYDATGRCYQYHLYCSPVRNPLRDRYAMWVRQPLEIARMQRSAAFIVGRNDFACFGVSPRPGGSTIRTVTRAEWREIQDGYQFEVEADAFLYHMVRRLVFFQVMVGQGMLPPEAIRDAIEKRVIPSIGLAPPQGLILKKVYYPSFEQQGNETL